MSTAYEDEIRDLVKGMHRTPGRLILVAAGAGTRALAWLLGVSGATRTLLEALIPYDESSFDDFLGRRPAKYVDSRTAGLLAGRAAARANYLYRGSEPVIGLACTATIVTDRPKKGQHRAHIAVWTSSTVDRYAIYLLKGIRDRQGEEELVSLVIMNALSKAFDLGIELPLPLQDGDRFSRDCFDIRGELRKVLDGSSSRFGIRDDGQSYGRNNNPQVILSGAFNPLHDGHLGLADIAARMLGHEAVFELAAVNAGKPSLSEEQCLRRLIQFAGRNGIFVSNAPLFAAKAELYPGATFVVGVDTAQRILQPRYYDDSMDKMAAALERIKVRGCGFLVAGRVDENGEYRRARDLAVPDQFSTLFTAIPGDQFRIDISSTTVRKRDNIAGAN